MRSPLFVTKPLELLLQEAQETGEHSLKRSLGPNQLVALGVVPILGMLINVGLMLGLGLSNWARLFVWLVVGMIVYFSYSRYHSRIRGAAA